MNLNEIINHAADEADAFLDGIRTAKEAKPAILEWVNEHHSDLSKADRQKAAIGIFDLLKKEGFFDVAERRTGLFGGEDANELVG